MNEELKKLFEGAEGFKPEFLTKIQGLVESKVAAAVTAAVQESEAKFDAELVTVKEAHAAEIAQLSEGFTSELATKLSGFLDQAVIEWANENAPAIDSSMKVEMAEKLLGGMVNLFAEASIAVSGDAEGVIKDLQERELAATQRAARAENTLAEVAAQNATAMTKALIATVCEGMADTKREKVINLMEGIPFTDEESYTSRVQRFRKLIEGEKDEGGEGDGEGGDGKDKGGKGGENKDEAGKEVNESVESQIAATLALHRKSVNG